MKQTTLFGHYARSAPTPAKTQKSPKRKRRASPQRESSESPSSSRTQGRARARREPESGSDDDLCKSRLQPAADVIDVEERSPTPPSPKKRRLRRAHSEDSGEETVATENDEREGDMIAFRVQRKGSGWRTKSLVLDSDDDGKPKKGKLVKERPATPEEDMTDEVDRDDILDSRLRDRGKKSTHRSAYLENLEKLKRRKRGDSSPISISDSGDTDEENESDPDAPLQGARPTTSLDAEDMDDEYDDGFVVDDDENQAPVELPTQYSMDTHQDLSHHFKIICQLFVHAAVAEDRDIFMSSAMKNKYFAVPLMATRKKLLGMRDSLVASSMWRTEFKQPLEQYPVLEIAELDFSVPGCAACRMGSRKSTRRAFLSGQRYYESTYEIRLDDDEDSGDDAPLEKGFDLGRFCARRTRAYHSFSHWEFHLFEILEQEITALRKSKRKGFVKVARAGGRQPPQDLTKADDIMEWLDSRGIIEEQYTVLKDMTESARHLEVDMKRGGNTDD